MNEFCSNTSAQRLTKRVSHRRWAPRAASFSVHCHLMQVREFAREKNLAETSRWITKLVVLCLRLVQEASVEKNVSQPLGVAAFADLWL